MNGSLLFGGPMSRVARSQRNPKFLDPRNSQPGIARGNVGTGCRREGRRVVPGLAQSAACASNSSSDAALARGVLHLTAVGSAWAAMTPGAPGWRLRLSRNSYQVTDLE